MSIDNIGWWIGSLSGALVNVIVATAVIDEVLKGSVLSCKMGSSRD